MRVGSVQDSEASKTAVASPNLLNEWLNAGRTIDTTVADLIRQKGLYGSQHDWQFIQATNCRVICADGFTVSIQASHYHYCVPRETFEDVSKYVAFELGFPSRPDEMLREYADSDFPDLTRCVFGCVPRNVVERLVASHGGIVSLGRKEIPLIGFIK